MLGKTMLPGDEELGKKDDDHRYAPARRSVWPNWARAIRWRRRRVLLAVGGALLIYVFLTTSGPPSQPGAPSRRGRFPMGRPDASVYDPSHVYNEPTEPAGPPPGVQVSRTRNTIPHTFDGQVRYYRLAKTLRSAATHTDGYETSNRNVLFAISSLKSASTLLPMICEMAKWSRNYVHAALMGRENIPFQDLLEINGIDKDRCPAVWHDARPDFAEYSSDSRAERGVSGALSHIYRFLHPQAIITDDALSEDRFFMKALHDVVRPLGIPVIEVPKNRWENFMWITRLDAGALKEWHSPNVDILIQAPSDSSSVLRLLASIRDADYSGLKPPRIILELPADLDESVKRHVEYFKWPLPNRQGLTENGLIIRRRIANHRATQEDAAIRFLELFYPATAANSHVLLLSAQAQLSPLYYHYVKYAMLEYKYSAFGSADSHNLLGTSLELPQVLLDGKSKFPPPTVSDMHTSRYQSLYSSTTSTQFLWQTPNTHATLFFGDKWAEFHSFLGNRVSKHQRASKTTSRAKLVSETLPAWAEYMLEFMRARGYSLLYPANSSESFVTVHNELYHVPEEFAPITQKDLDTVPELSNEPFLRGEVAPHPTPVSETRIVPVSKPLHMALPFDGDFPELPHVPQLLYDGQLIEPDKMPSIALEYAAKFREEIGGCKTPKGKQRKVIPGEAGDLFCFGDEDEADWEDVTSESRSHAWSNAARSDSPEGEEEVPRTVNFPTPTRVKHLPMSTLVVADEF